MKLRVTTSTLNVRSAPDPTASIVATLSEGDEVESAEIDPWRLVFMSGGRRGWVHGSYVTEAKPAPSLPQGTPVPTVKLACPYCHHPFEALSVESVKVCPNPNRLPGDTAEQRAAGGRLCRASFTYVAPHSR